MMGARLETGYFLLSLDLELGWGYHDCFQPHMFSVDGQRERRSIHRILDALDEFDITATWAVVGHLFYDKCEEYDTCPAVERRGKYPSLEHVYKNNDPLWHGKDVIDTLLSRGSRHEIGFHGYTHKIFDERSTTEAEARTEIEEWLRKAKERDLVPGALTFPRNVVGYRHVLREYGFTCYRGAEPVPRAHSLRFAGKALKHLDEILAVSTPSVFDLQADPSGLLNLPSSEYVFGFNRGLEKALDALNLHNIRLRRIAKGVKMAAAEGKIMHLWAHPHEFRTPKDIEKLRYVLAHVADEVARGRMQSVGMAELARTASPALAATEESR